MKRRRIKIANPKKFFIFIIIFTLIISTAVVEAKKCIMDDVKKTSSTYIKPKTEFSNSLNTKEDINKEKSVTPKVEKVEEKVKENKVIAKNIKKENKPLKKSVPKHKEKVNKVTSKKSISEYKTIFNKDLFLGDSITEGLSFYEILDDSNVIGIKGLTVSKAMGQVNNIANAKPNNVFIFLGENDVIWNIGSEKFASNYLKLVKGIKAKLPNTNIYVLSIPPATSKAEQKFKLMSNSRINEFNNALKNMAKNEGINYLDMSSIFKNSDLYEKDGIHLKHKFYGIWLEFIKNNVK